MIQEASLYFIGGAGTTFFVSMTGIRLTNSGQDVWFKFRLHVQQALHKLHHSLIALMARPPSSCTQSDDAE